MKTYMWVSKYIFLYFLLLILRDSITDFSRMYFISYPYRTPLPGERLDHYATQVCLLSLVCCLLRLPESDILLFKHFFFYRYFPPNLTI
jgi:hypothetical protein